MNPRRLLAYLGIFLVLLAVYWGLASYQERKEARETAAKKIFQVKEGDITEVTLKKPKEEVRLARKDGGWVLTAPLKAQADQDVVNAILVTLASMQRERVLKTGGDLKPYGLDKPLLVVEFTTTGGKSHRLAIGPKTPGEMNCYAYEDQDTRQVLVINVAHESSLDRPLAAFRDKTLFTFAPDKARSLSLITADASVHLEKQASGQWRWQGREKFPVRADRVAALLRFIQGARVRDFVSDAPKELAAYGLAPPRMQVAVVEKQKPERLLLGKKAGAADYARKVPDGPVVLLNRDLLGHITKALDGLEDRRVWRGVAPEANKVVWGPPGKTWTGVKDKDSVKITGPGKQEVKQPAVRLEVSLLKLQQLEFSRQAPPKKSVDAKPAYVAELYDGAGKSLFRLEQLGQPGNKGVVVRVKTGGKLHTGLVSLKAYQAWQSDLARLAPAPPAKPEAPAKKEKKAPGKGKNKNGAKNKKVKKGNG